MEGNVEILYRILLRCRCSMLWGRPEAVLWLLCGSSQGSRLVESGVPSPGGGSRLCPQHLICCDWDGLWVRLWFRRSVWWSEQRLLSRGPPWVWISWDGEVRMNTGSVKLWCLWYHYPVCTPRQCACCTVGRHWETEGLVSVSTDPCIPHSVLSEKFYK